MSTTVVYQRGKGIHDAFEIFVVVYAIVKRFRQ